MCARLNKFMVKHDVIYKYQYGFQKGSSTSFPLTILVDKIGNAIKNNNVALGVFIDLSKAFDTVDHGILLKKLYKYGVRGALFAWFSSYLSNRKQCVYIDNCISDILEMKCGVPQGSNLGPVLFLLYINDLENVSSNLFTLLFADDSNFFMSGTDINSVIRNMNHELQNVYVWLSANKLSLNVNKTHYIVFTSPRMPIESHDDLFINNNILNQVFHTKFIGVVSDSKLNWSNHIHYIKLKVTRGIGVLCRCKKNLMRSSLKTIYLSFIYSHLIYCIHVWGSSCKTNMTPLFILQKRAIRVITSSKYDCPSDPLFRSLGLLNLYNMYIYSVSLFMFKYHFGYSHSTINELFVSNITVHHINTRQRDNLHIPICRNNILYNSITYKGVVIWNFIRNKFVISNNIYKFKKDLKLYLICNIFPQNIHRNNT